MSKGRVWASRRSKVRLPEVSSLVHSKEKRTFDAVWRTFRGQTLVRQRCTFHIVGHAHRERDHDSATIYQRKSWLSFML